MKKLITEILLSLLLITGFLVYDGCKSHELKSQRYDITYSYDSTFNGNDTIVSRGVQKHEEKFRKKILWFIIPFVLLYVGLLFIKK